MDQVCRRINAAKFLANQVDGGRCGWPSSRRWSNDHCVSAFDCHHRLVDWCCDRVGRRGNRSNYTNRLGVLHNSPTRIIIDDANRSDTKQITKRAKSLALVLGNLVRHITKSCILDRLSCQLGRVFSLIYRPGNGRNDLVDSCLIRLKKKRHRRASAAD